ncbi:DUF1707 SHOCT-like domain-containing protein [Nonomuraea sp. bgisy101]|uniref:DUF1707 SHOCT-like domain-containing protein n=1 Tax=Nonomuraea sp. bgisy101 TaxID=3413784 RepID=UPI003D7528F3
MTGLNMMEHPGRTEDQQVRASDHERDRAADRVRVAAADGRIDLAELDTRLTRIYEAKTHADLERVCRDLPEPGRTDLLVVDQQPTSRFALGLFGGFEHEGQWVVPRRFSVVSMFGGGRIDLSEAAFTAHETRIRALALWGGTEIVVPDDIEVKVRGLGLFGLFGKRGTRRGKPGAPRIVISGLAMFGAVVIRTRRQATRGDLTDRPAA